MKNLRCIIVIFSCLLFQHALSQTMSLSLQESIDKACNSSLEAFRAKNLYRASYWEYRTFKAGRLPSLTLETTPIRYSHGFIQRYDYDENIDVYRRQQNLYSRANLSLSQNIDATGGTLFIDSELDYLRSFGENITNEYSSVPVRIGYYQSLFGFNSFKWDKRIEPLKYEKAKLQYLYNREQISESVIEYYFSLIMAETEYKMALENVNSADTLYKIGLERQKIASISQEDLLTLKLDAVNARNTLKNAEVSLTKARFNFNSFLGIEKEISVELEIPETSFQMQISPDIALLYTKQNNPDILGYKQEVMESEMEVEKTQKSANFDANVSVSFGLNQISNDLRNVYRDPLSKEVVTVGLTIPLIDWGVRKGKANMAKNNLNVIKISVQQKEQQLEQDVIVTVSDFNVQQDLVNTAHEALELATLAYNVTRERFIIGKADLNSLTLSLDRQNAAQRNYILALKEYWLNYYKLRKLTLYDFVGQVFLSEEFDDLHGLTD